MGFFFFPLSSGYPSLAKQDLFILHTLFPPRTKSVPKHPDREALVWR